MSSKLLNKKMDIETLESICLNLIANNCHLIDSCEYIPESIGSLIFNKSIELKYFEKSQNDHCKKVISKFENVYKSLILDRLILMPSMRLNIEDNLDFIISFRYLVSLDIFALQLGDDHPLIENIPHLLNLKKLIIGQNCLSDKFLRKITTPISIFNKGPKFLQHLNLSGNICITTKSHVFLKRLKYLEFLNLTGTSFEIRDAEILANQMNLKLFTELQNQITSKAFEFYNTKCYHNNLPICQILENSNDLENNKINNLRIIEKEKEKLNKFSLILSGYVHHNEDIKNLDLLGPTKNLIDHRKCIKNVQSNSEVYEEHSITKTNDICILASGSDNTVQKGLYQYLEQRDYTRGKNKIENYNLSDSDVYGQNCCVDTSWAKCLLARMLSNHESDNVDAIISSPMICDSTVNKLTPNMFGELQNLPMKPALTFYSKYKKRSQVIKNYRSDLQPLKINFIILMKL